MLTRGIGVKNYKPQQNKDRSNSVISALSDHDHEEGVDGEWKSPTQEAALRDLEHNLDSLQFNVEGTSLVN